MNMVNGIIISTFTQIREENSNKETDQEDVCFICNRKRVQFEKRKINFNKHIKYEHKQENYIYYLVTLLLTKESDLNSDQSYILESMKKKDIAFFPVEKTLYLREVDGEKEDDDGDN